MSLFRDPLTKALAETAQNIMEKKVMCEACGKMHEEGSCSMNESIQLVAKELTAYAKKNGGIDKKDMLKAAEMMKSNQTKELVKFVNDLDTDPRDVIIMMVANNLGFKTAEKMFKVNIRSSKMYEDIELPEEITDEDAGDFVVAAAAAKKAGKKKFTFGGKEYPVTIKTDIKTEEVELDEAMKITHVVIDTADDDKVVSMASDEKGAKSSIVSAERPPMSIKDKKTLKIVKLKKPAGQKAADKLIGYPLKEETLDEELEEAKSDYDIKHKTFSSAIQHAVEVAMKKGYEVDADDYDEKVAMGPKKPSKGKTNSYSIKLTKNGKEQRKALQVQIANLDNKFYELNMYIQ